MNFTMQTELEQKYSKKFKGRELEQYREEILEQPLKNYRFLIDNYVIEREQDQEVLDLILKMEPEETLWKILKQLHIVRVLSLQGILGMFFHHIEATTYRKGQVMELFIYAIAESKWAEFKKVGKYLSLVATHNIDLDQKANYVLPAILPSPVVVNHKAGYENEQFHVITGGKLKEHDQEVCLSHINRLNFTAFSLNLRLRVFAKPHFDATPKYLVSKERYETDSEILERQAQFHQLIEELPERINDITRTGNKMFYKARYDYRGRTYLKAYHFDFIGNKYIRALTQSAVGEHIDWE